METDLENTTLKICRTCLKEVTPDCKFSNLDFAESNVGSTTIRHKLKDFLPELDLHITPSAVICSDCSATIDLAHKFKHNCLRIEENIHSFFQKTGFTAGFVDLVHFVRQSKRQYSDLDENAFNLTEEILCDPFEEDYIKSYKPGIDLSFLDAGKDQDDCELDDSFLFSTNLDTFNESCESNDYEKFPTNDIVDANFDNLRKDGNGFECGDNYVGESKLENHQNTRANKTKTQLEMVSLYRAKIYNCNVCSYRTVRKSNLTIHIRNHKSHKKVKIVKNANVQNLSRQKPPYKCAECGFQTTHKSYFNTHIKSHTDDSTYQCTECDCKCLNSSSLIRHMRSHTGEKPFKCNDCSFTTAYKGYLTTHMKLHTGDKPFKCTECEYSSNQQNHLKVHMRIHTGDKPYKCNLCEYSGTTKSRLKIHIRKHTGDKPYKCNRCSYSATTRAALKGHIARHTEDKPYKCSDCSFKTSYKNNLITHINVHTGNRPFKCTECDYGAVRKSQLTDHFKIHMNK